MKAGVRELRLHLPTPFAAQAEADQAEADIDPVRLAKGLGDSGRRAAVASDLVMLLVRT
jgi:hypothetical protein